jgi:hypothetical protein
MEHKKSYETSVNDPLAALTIAPVADLVERYCHCALCGSNLHFVHMTDFSKNLTHEVAKCPECRVQARSVTHRLQ